MSVLPCRCKCCLEREKFDLDIFNLYGTNDKRFKELKKQLKQTQERLAEAEGVIEFYGDVGNWSYQQIINDTSEVNGSIEAGAKAREYQNKYKGDKNK